MKTRYDYSFKAAEDIYIPGAKEVIFVEAITLCVALISLLMHWT